MSLGVGKSILKLPPNLRTEHLLPLVPAHRVALHHPSPYIALPPSLAASPDALPTGFTLFPSFFNIHDQRVLLESALSHLDARGGLARDSQTGKKLRRPKAEILADRVNKGLQGYFHPERFYRWEEGHFDGVIRHYREALVGWQGLPDVKDAQSSWQAGAEELLEKLDTFLPQGGERTTHVLHLSEKGYIDAHVDGKESMGKTIIGVSLGADRVLRLTEDKSREEGEEEEAIEILLKSGSVYVQTGEVRYNWKHSIPLQTHFQGEELRPGQRLSLMLRDVHTPDASPAELNLTSSLPDSPTRDLLYGDFAQPAILPPSQARSFAPLSVRDELILTGQDPNLVDDRPWTRDEEKGLRGAGMGRQEQRQGWRERKERTNRDLVMQGMKNRKWGGK